MADTLGKAYGKEPARLNFEEINHFISTNAAGQINTAFHVSEILERMLKERQFLHAECCRWLGSESISSKLSFKYDEFNKDFKSYLPSSSKKFVFLVLLKSRSQNVFGAVSKNMGEDSMAMAFNLSEMKIMNKN